MKRRGGIPGWVFAATLALVCVLATVVVAGSVSIPHTFTPKSVADANQVNANFEAVSAAVNDNDTRITALETAPGSARLTFSGRSLAENPNLGDARPDIFGMICHANTSETPILFVPSPADYAGGNVTLTIAFLKNGTAAGDVSFFLQPTSFDVGEAMAAPPGMYAPAIDVTAGGEYSYFEQQFTVPGDRLQKALWYFSLRRLGAADTFPNPVSITSIHVDYPAGS